MKHLFHEAIVAWANGEPIQSRKIGSYVWKDYIAKELKGWTPAFNCMNYEWRVKPKPITIKYRLAYMVDEFNSIHYIKLYQQDYTNENIASSLQFKKWITDWIEYEATE